MTTRHYGWKIGDIVEMPTPIPGAVLIGEIISFHGTDNNKCYIRGRGGTIFPAVCEWLKHPTAQKGGK